MSEMIHCPKCAADISGTYEGADASVGIMCGGWYCDACDAVYSERDFPREPLPDDVPLTAAEGPTKPIGTPISQLSGRPGHPGFAEFCRIAKSWGYD